MRHCEALGHEEGAELVRSSLIQLSALSETAARLHGINWRSARYRGDNDVCSDKDSILYLKMLGVEVSMWVWEEQCGCSDKHIFSILQSFYFLSLYIVHMCIMFILGLSIGLSLLFKKKKTVQNIKIFVYFHLFCFKLYVIIFPQYYRK